MSRATPPPGFVRKSASAFHHLAGKALVTLRSINRFFLIQLAGSLLILAFYLFLMMTPLLARFETIFLDAFFKYRAPVPVSDKIVYIEIAEDSFQAIQRLPWPRDYHAVLIHILQEWGAEAIVFDMIFSAPSRPHEDALLAEAIQKSERVYLPVFRERRGGEKSWLHSIPEFEKFIKGTGHVNVASDRDGVLRRIPAFLAAQDRSYPHYGLRIAYDVLGETLPVSARDLSLPLDPQGNLFVNWAGKWARTFSHYSYVDLLRSFEAQNRGQKPIIPPDAVKGKICLIGFTASGSTDIKAIPLEPSYPGVGILANVINNVLTRRFILPAPFYVNAAALVLLGLLAMVLFSSFRNLVSLAGALCLALFWVAGSFALFSLKGVWLYVMHPLILIFSLFIFTAVYAKILGDREKLYFFRLSTRDGLTGLYVMRYFRVLLDREIHNVQVRKEPISLVLIDIDHFKRINDTYGHQAGDEVLKKTAQVIQSCIRVHHPYSEDSVARYGGEEFIVMLVKADLTHAAFNVAERVRKSVEQTAFEWEGNKIPVTISLGISALGEKEQTAEAMIRKADEALYRAKRGGRNQTCLEISADSEPPGKADNHEQA